MDDPAGDDPAGDELEREVRELCGRDDKIGAIRVLRERRGLELGAAKAAVEHVLAGGKLPAAPPATSAELPAEVRELAAQGRKLEAIRLLRRRTGLELAEAKRRVERVTGAPAKSGCSAVLLCFLVVGGFSIF